jgi:hypothetical protein
MQLREGEKIVKIYHHHLTPYLFDILKVIAVFAVLWTLVLGMRDVFSSGVFLIVNIALLGLFIAIDVYLGLIYWLDRLVVTNFRVIYIDYKYLTVKDESTADLKDIQDIITHEKGILSRFKFFDYGTLKLDTPSSYVTLVFPDAPDPEGIRQLIYKVRNQ